RMRVDEADGDRGAGRKAEVSRSLFRQSADGSAASADFRANAGKALIGQFLETDLAEVGFIPPVFVTQIGPFAGHGAGGTHETSRGLPGEEVREIEELPGAVEGLRLVFLEPQELRRFHLRGNGAA